jgi:hypothetical protein
MSLTEVLAVALEVVLAGQLLPLERPLLDFLAVLVFWIIDFIVIDVRGIVVRRSLLLMSRLYKGVVKLEYLLAELIVLLVRVLNLADSILDRPSNFLNFLLDVFILATSLGELLPKVVGLLLEERNV